MAINMNLKPLWTETKPLAELPLVASKVASAFDGVESFALLLRGDLGAGKTTFTRYFLQVLGLSPFQPVTSPTYTYLNTYAIGSHVYAHMDLYRLWDRNGSSEDLFEEVSSARGIVVEWARASDVREYLHGRVVFELSIFISAEGGVRDYCLSSLEDGS